LSFLNQNAQSVSRFVSISQQPPEGKLVELVELVDEESLDVDDVLSVDVDELVDWFGSKTNIKTVNTARITIENTIITQNNATVTPFVVFSGGDPGVIFILSGKDAILLNLNNSRVLRINTQYFSKKYSSFTSSLY
jgi:hypothetical protein